MAQAIQFPYYQSSNRVPGTYVDFDSSNANTATFNQRSLLIGQMLPSGNTVANIPVIISSVVDAQAKCGMGSMLYDMAVNYRNADSFGELWILPLLDNPAGTPGVATVTITGAATASGTLNLYIEDTAVQTAVAVSDTPTIVATKLVAAMANYPGLSVTAAAVAGVVTFTAVHKGIAASDVSFVMNYYGVPNGEVTPPGLVVAITPMTAGTADPIIDIGLANLSNTTFDFIACPYTAATQLTSIKNFLSQATGRWGWGSQLYGIAWNAYRGTFGAATTFGLGQNDPHITTLPVLNSPTPVWAASAIYAATSGASLRSDPALPLTQLTLTGMLAPSVDQQLTLSERNTFYYSGMSGYTVQSGAVILERAVTNYQKNAGGLADNSYLDVETDAVLTFVARTLQSDISSKFARKKLVNDGVIAAAGSNIVTPSIVLSYAVGLYSSLADQGLVQNVAGFAANASAQNAGKGQVSLYLPVVLANQLREIAMDIAFSKP
jgi:phage tail sheath gpL-like